MGTLGKLLKEVSQASFFVPQTRIPVPKIVYNPRLKRSVAKIRMKILPSTYRDIGGKGIYVPMKFLSRPQIEVSEFYKSLPKEERRKVIKHELEHLVAVSAGATKHTHHAGGLFGMSLSHQKLPRIYGKEDR